MFATGDDLQTIEKPVTDFAQCLRRLKKPPLLAYISCCLGDAGGFTQNTRHWELLVWLRVLALATEQLEEDLAKLPYLGMLLKDHQDIVELGDGNVA